MFYKDFCTGKEVHEIVVVYYDVETKNFLTFLKLDQLFPLWSREEFEQAV
jgi:hypothetical protein